MAIGNIPVSISWQIPQNVPGKFNPSPPYYMLPTYFHRYPGFNEEYVQYFEDMRDIGYEEWVINLYATAMRELQDCKSNFWVPANLVCRPSNFRSIIFQIEYYNYIPPYKLCLILFRIEVPCFAKTNSA